MSSVTFYPTSVPAVDDWTYESDALNDDNLWAVNPNYVTTKLCIKGCTESIPEGKIITGIEVHIKLSGCNHTGDAWMAIPGGQTLSGRMALTKDGSTPSSGTFRDGVSSTYKWSTQGDDSELWGESWSLDDINDNSEFGLLIWRAVGEDNEWPYAHDFSIDDCYIVVYYTSIETFSGSSSISLSPTASVDASVDTVTLTSAEGGCDGVTHLTWTD